MERYKDLTDFPAESWLQVNNCSTEGNSGPSYTLLRLEGRKDYYLFYIAQGRVEIELNGEIVEIAAHSCVLFPPGIRQLIRYPSDPALNIYYVHFTGTAVDEVMQPLKERKVMVCSVRDCTMVEVLFRQLLQSVLAARVLCGRLQITDLKVNGLLLQLIALVTQEGSEKMQPEQDAVVSAMLYISEHFREDIDLAKCAADAHLSLSRFAHLFRDKMGISPHQFILSRRIDEAKELLTYSSMTVSEIAKSVGFSDASYFSRIFRKHTGHTPTDYRPGK